MAAPRTCFLLRRGGGAWVVSGVTSFAHQLNTFTEQWLSGTFLSPRNVDALKSLPSVSLGNAGSSGYAFPCRHLAVDVSRPKS